jgi:hypothetical protein
MGDGAVPASLPIHKSSYTMHEKFHPRYLDDL